MREAFQPTEQPCIYPPNQTQSAQLFLKAQIFKQKQTVALLNLGKIWFGKARISSQLITVKQDLEISKFSQRPKVNTKQIYIKRKSTSKLLCQPHLEMFGHFGAQLSNNDLPPLRSWVQALYQTSDRTWKENLSTLCGKYVSVCNMVGMKIVYEIQLMSYHTLFQDMHSLHPQHVFLCSRAGKHTVHTCQPSK